MSSMDERRHVARRLAEHDGAIDLEPYDQEPMSGQDLVDTYDERAAELIAAFDAIREYREAAERAFGRAK